MSKDPAFLFYTGDFSTGTQFFTDEQVGKYVRLLMAQHQLGHLEEKHMIQICKSYDKDVFSKFVKDRDGLFYNKRLDDEVIKRKKYSISRSENRKSKNIISETYDEHMENKNEIKDNNTLTIKNTVTNGMWESEKNLFLNSEQYHYRLMTEHSFKKDPYYAKVNDFLKSLELQEDYKSDKELKRHFKHWFDKPQNNGFISSNGQTPLQKEIDDKVKKLLNQ